MVLQQHGNSVDSAQACHCDHHRLPPSRSHNLPTVAGAASVRGVDAHSCGGVVCVDDSAVLVSHVQVTSFLGESAHAVARTVIPILTLSTLWLCALNPDFRWYAPKQSGTLAAAAAAAASELRRANPQQYPPASHSWFRIAGRQLAKPLLCAVCFDHMVSTDDDSAVGG